MRNVCAKLVPKKRPTNASRAAMSRTVGNVWQWSWLFRSSDNRRRVLHIRIRPGDKKTECGVAHLGVTPPQEGAHERVSGQDNAHCFFMSAVSSILNLYHKGRLWMLVSTWKFSRDWKGRSLVSAATSKRRGSCTATTPPATPLSSSATTWPGAIPQSSSSFRTVRT